MIKRGCRISFDHLADCEGKIVRFFFGPTPKRFRPRPDFDGLSLLLRVHTIDIAGGRHETWRLVDLIRDGQLVTVAVSNLRDEIEILEEEP